MNDNYTYKPTAAFWKIQKFLFEAIEKYKDLEAQTGKKQKRVFIIQGGAGASKTISILMLIIDSFLHTKKQHRVTIASEELTKMKETVVMDFYNITKDWGLYKPELYAEQKARYNFTPQRFIEFKGLDKKDVGKGRRREILYINEANKITLDKYEDISLRANITILDYNPDRRFWVHDLINDFNFISLTYQDNEYLGEAERNNIEDYERKGFNLDGTVKSQYYANKWRVYGLGELGINVGQILNYNIEPIPDGAKLLGIGLDFGYSPDPIAAVELYRLDNKIWFNQILYKTEFSQQNTIDFFRSFNCQIICDGSNPQIIAELRKHGISAKKCMDKTIEFGLNLLNEYEICCTTNSKDLMHEMDNYCRDDNGRIVPSPDHLIDAARYVGREFLPLSKVYSKKLKGLGYA